MSQEPPKITNPKLWADPNKISFKQLYKYTSWDMIKINSSIKNYKGSLFYIGGTIAACLVTKVLVDSAVNNWIFGANGNGGNFLTMWTTNTDTDYQYNREFQRMRYLTEEPAGNDPYNKTQDAILADLGYKWQPMGNNNQVHKKSPHYKYF
ncbi:hypothetical protein PPERSA_06890 [Pseudocohnilembus persalinus]|uniref:Uncharacterized protein n=1 Tax=Pseudocohnilembus persalinus TaxID=266149 RepID=A0A0V0QYE3_PSEPJ|nr:hypothetical protein PPERSA_06890 [Pseudocohnilembus persalinus]|eukprot:KRX07275.1 hypothetical protein PPERSA_06890 [Pseudocohnilembus persalinus]